jgi:hypothetical protein
MLISWTWNLFLLHVLGRSIDIFEKYLHKLYVYFEMWSKVMLLQNSLASITVDSAAGKISFRYSTILT